ncbi:MAG: hypothetical protein ACXADY_25875, partial [Candidatus Hodarchaeales archaeon]
KTQFSAIDEQLEQQTQNAESKYEEFKSQFSTIDEQLEQQTQNAESKYEEFKSQFSTIDEQLEQQTQNAESKYEEFKTQFTQIQQIQNEHKDRISSHQQSLEEHITEIQDRVQKDEFKAALNEAVDDFNDKNSSLSQNQDNSQLEFKNHTEETQNRFDTIVKTIELLGDGLAQLEQQNISHVNLLEEQRQKFSQVKTKLKEIVSLSKEDQRAHFNNFSRIIESYNENIRTELNVIVQSLKESDTKILDEVSSSFMPKKIGKELQKTIADLSSDLEVEAQKTREDLIQGLKKNVQEYETTMEEQNLTIKNYQRELERFQDEILAIIDRKVNEKYEVVFSLLSKVTIQAEELALLIKTSEIHIPSSPFQENQSSSDFIENHDEPTTETITSEESVDEDNELNEE